MKKIITFFLFVMIAFVAKAQTLSGTYNNNGYGTTAYYTVVKWEVSYRFEEDNGNIYINFYSPKITIPNYAKYHIFEDYTQREYSLADLGISVWPQKRQLPFAMSLQVGISDGFKDYQSFASCQSDFTCGRNFVATIANIKNYSLGRFRVVTFDKFHANLDGEEETNTLIKAKKNSGKTIGSTGTIESNSNTVAQTSTTDDIPTNTSGNDPLAIYTPTSAYSGATTEKEVYTQAAATVVGGLIDEMNANYEKKQARLDAEYKAKISAEYDAKQNKFNIEFLPLIAKAQEGNDEAKMILFFASYALSSEHLVKKKFQWYEEALENNNTDAMVFKASANLHVKENENILLLEKAAALGSSDAMLALADWYNNKEFLYKSKNGGENEQKALEWYNKAAEAGSPKAMFYLGVIYKYGRTLGYMDNNFGSYKAVIKYNTSKDEKLAFYWFSKASTLYNYKKTPYARSQNESFYSVNRNQTNSFTPSVFMELAKIYKEGKVVPQDKEKAKEFERLAFTYKVSIENEDFAVTNRYK